MGDFGLSQQAGTKKSQFLGTWQWVANEILAGKKYDEKSDVYSFAIVFYEIVSRNLPFTEFREYIQVMTEWVDFKCETCGFDSVCQKLPTCKFVQVKVQGNREEFKKQSIIKAITNENLRPTVPSSCNSSIIALIQQAWDPLPSKRPPMTAIVSYLKNTTEYINSSFQNPPWSFCYKSSSSLFNQTNYLLDSKLQKKRKIFKFKKMRRLN